MIVSTNKIDAWIANRVYWLVQHWSKVTGRDNFTLARLLAKLSVIIIGTTVFVVQHHAVIGMTTSICLTGYWIWFTRSQLREYAVIERMVERWEDGTADINLQEATTMRSICVWRQWHTVWSILGISFGIAPPPSVTSFVIAVAFMFFSLSGYAALCFNGGGKSVWARAKDKVKEWARRTADSLSPAPTPIPLPVRV